VSQTLRGAGAADLPLSGAQAYFCDTRSTLRSHSSQVNDVPAIACREPSLSEKNYWSIQRILNCKTQDSLYVTSCRRTTATICPAPLLPRGRRSASRGRADGNVRSSTFWRPTRSPAHRCSCLSRQHGGE